MLGYDPAEVMDRGIGELFGPGYETLYWLDLCRREGRVSFEGRALHKDGRLVPVFDERVPRIDPYGEHAGFTGYMQDVTQRVRVREILRQQETQAGVGRMAAGIVHEIMNPISGVTQYLDAMLARLDGGEKIPAEEMRKGAGVMRDALRRTTELVQHLRGFARTAVRPARAVDPFVILDDLRALFRQDLHQRGVAMVVEGGPGMEVAADDGGLAQVFLNLLTNARDAMPEGGTLTVELSAEDSTARIRFRDTGVGIPRESLGRVFDFLYTTKGEKGTGYGLSISKDIVESYGGRIEVESEAGKGATFTVVLPRRVPAPQLRKDGA
jgi:two-component system NtrC family sensor kinase